jgi:integrase
VEGDPGELQGKENPRPWGHRVCGITVSICGVFRGSVFQSRVQLATAGRLQSAGGGEITADGLGHSAATILLNHVGKDLREIQELLRHENIRTMVRYTHVGYE